MFKNAQEAFEGRIRPVDGLPDHLADEWGELMRAMGVLGDQQDRIGARQIVPPPSQRRPEDPPPERISETMTAQVGMDVFRVMREANETSLSFSLVRREPRRPFSGPDRLAPLPLPPEVLVAVEGRHSQDTGKITVEDCEIVGGKIAQTQQGIVTTLVYHFFPDNIPAFADLSVFKNIALIKASGHNTRLQIVPPQHSQFQPLDWRFHDGAVIQVSNSTMYFNLGGISPVSTVEGVQALMGRAIAGVRDVVEACIHRDPIQRVQNLRALEERVRATK